MAYWAKPHAAATVVQPASPDLQRLPTRTFSECFPISRNFRFGSLLAHPISDRQRILLGAESEVPGEEKDRRICGHGPRVARGPEATLPARAASPRSDARGSDAAQTANQGRSCCLCNTQGDRRTGVRTDQTGAGLPTVSLTWTGEGTRRVGRGVSDAQHLEVTPDVLWIETQKKGQLRAKGMPCEPPTHGKLSNTPGACSTPVPPPWRFRPI
jgi:hypothetical protein